DRRLLSYIYKELKKPLLYSLFKDSKSASVRTGMQWCAALLRVDVYFYLHHPKISCISSTICNACLFLILAIKI
uniref:Uncharacterized protein n=1 Tax=Mus spicilegus TaxID=10103 RepID=A0A8C6G5Q0_MUSSI